MGDDEVRSMAIEDVELSFRSAGLLMELGVETVGDLLDLPSITTSALVKTELTAALEDLGATYAGEWVVPAGPPVREATGSLTERWKTVADWLGAEHPDALATFRPPAKEAEIAAAEASLGVALPEDYRAFLALHDGQEDIGPMVAYCSLLPVGELATSRTYHAGLFSEGSFGDDAVQAGIAPVAWNDGWIPVGKFRRSVMILDLAPTSAGTLGQIFIAHSDDDVRRIVAPSFADLVSRYFQELQDGTIDLDNT